MFRKLSSLSSKRVAVFGAVFVIAGAAAYAYWTNGGSGSGSAGTGTNVAITVNQTSTPSGLYPGGPSGALSGTFTNSNASKVFVSQVNATLLAPTGPNVATAPACTAADYALSGFPVTVGSEIDSGTGVGAWSGGSVRLLNSATNQNSCKGATINIAYTSN
jgi:hypothetical protein